MSADRQTDRETGRQAGRQQVLSDGRDSEECVSDNSYVSLIKQSGRQERKAYAAKTGTSFLQETKDMKGAKPEEYLPHKEDFLDLKYMRNKKEPAFTDQEISRPKKLVFKVKRQLNRLMEKALIFTHLNYLLSLILSRS